MLRFKGFVERLKFSRGSVFRPTKKTFNSSFTQKVLLIFKILKSNEKRITRSLSLCMVEADDDVVSTVVRLQVDRTRAVSDAAAQGAHQGVQKP